MTVAFKAVSGNVSADSVACQSSSPVPYMFYVRTLNPRVRLPLSAAAAQADPS